MLCTPPVRTGMTAGTDNLGRVAGVDGMLEPGPRSAKRWWPAPWPTTLPDSSAPRSGGVFPTQGNRLRPLALRHAPSAVAVPDGHLSDAWKSSKWMSDSRPYSLDDEHSVRLSVVPCSWGRIWSVGVGWSTGWRGSKTCRAGTDRALADTFWMRGTPIDRLESFAAELLAAVDDSDPLRGGRDLGVGVGAMAHRPALAGGQSIVRRGRLRERLPLTTKAWANGEISAGGPHDLSRHQRRPRRGLRRARRGSRSRAAQRNFRELDGIIRHYRKCADDSTTANRQIVTARIFAGR